MLFAWYNARSAAAMMFSDVLTSDENVETPMLTVTRPSGCVLPCGKSAVLTRCRMRSAIVPASAMAVCGNRMQNSSPP
jgi:hypothetical protein